MADGVDVTVDFPELEEIKAAFRELPPNIAAKYMASALLKSIDPGLRLLKSLTPKGPTGNLRRSIAKKSKRYSKGGKGAGVALAGFRAAPKGKESKANQKGHHQGFLEFGTKERKTKGRIASSFSRSGKVKMLKGKRKGIFTKPAPPKGFVKAAPKGEVVDLKKFPIGGSAGLPPVKTAFERGLGQMKSSLTNEMTVSLNNALKEMASPFRTGKK